MKKHVRDAINLVISEVWSSPIGLFGVVLTTVSITLMLVGLVVEIFGLVENPYASILTFMVLPAGMVIGLLLIPLAVYIRRMQWKKQDQVKPLIVNLSDPKHRFMVVLIVFLTVINLVILSVIGYEGYHFTDSPYFCGVVCHKVMAPEYTAYQRSPHTRVACVECHIGPGASWFVQAKISGLRQVAAVILETYHKPIPAPVEYLRPARDTCEQCHWPDKFSGKRVKTLVHFSNTNQTKPDIVDVALHIGGRNPYTNRFEGIHWHVSKDVEVSYLPADEKRMVIPRVKVRRPDRSEDEYIKEGEESQTGEGQGWRIMDCIDCHNRPTHIYDLPEERVDLGLLSKAINPDIEGIRQDSIEALKTEYSSRKKAKVQIRENIFELQRKRQGEDFVRQHEKDIEKASDFIIKAYLDNVWPEMNVGWGTYGSHLGHMRSEEGFGCFRCHDWEHINKKGDALSQDCTLCHDMPEYR